MDAKELTELAYAKSGETSIRAFANRIGVSHVAVGYWLAGTSVPTFEQAAELAAVAGLPIIKTASEVRLHSAQGMKHQEILKRMATIAVAFVLFVGASFPTLAANQQAGHNADSVYIMRNWVRAKLSWVWLWLTSCIPARKPRKDELQA